MNLFYHEIRFYVVQYTIINVLFRSTFVFLSTVVILIIIILHSNELQEININELCLINYVVILVQQNLSL